MPVTKTWAGGTYNLPLNREPKGSWGTEVSNFLIALANNAVSLTGGTQTLSAELNLGATYGVVLAYAKSASANIASTGMLRLAKGDAVTWRNNANSADLPLGIDASDNLSFNGMALATLSGGTVPIGQGGTGQTTQQAALDALAGTQSAGKYLRSDGSHTTLTSIQAVDVPTLNQSTTGTASNVTGTVAIANGGTGQVTKTAAYDALTPITTKGDLVTSDGTNATRLGVGSDGTVLSADSTQSAGLRWVSPLTNPMTAVGDLIVGGSAGAASRFAGSTASTKKFLTQTGTGTASATPAWAGLVASDLPTFISATTTFNGGVIFGADGSSILNFYVENGAWSPAAAFTTQGSASYSVDYAKFQRIGKIVTADFSISVTKGTASGNLTITGLPYASTNDTNYTTESPLFQNNSGANWRLRVTKNTTVLAVDLDGAASPVTAAALTTTVVFRGTITYRVD